MIEIAKERNIDYKPSAEAMQNLNDYCDRKGLPNPLGEKHKPNGNGTIAPPIYNPDPNIILPPPGGNQFPPGPGGFIPPPTGYIPPPTNYNPPPTGYIPGP